MSDKKTIIKNHHLKKPSKKNSSNFAEFIA